MVDDQIATLQAENAALRAECDSLWQQLAQNDRARLMLEAAPIGFVISNLQGQCVESNRAMQEMLGYSEQELRAMPFAAFTHPDDLMLELPLFEGIMAGDRSQYEVQKRYVRKDGQIIHVALRVAAVRTPTGAVDFFIGTIEDISARKQQEADLQMRQFALDHASDMVGLMNVSGQFTYVNDTTCKQLGYTREELLTMGLSDIDPDFSPEQWAPTCNQIRQARSFTLETHYRRKDGSSFPVELSSTYLQIQNEEFALLFMRDITERRQAERDLRLAQQTIEQAPDGVFWSDMTGQVVYVNAAACRNLGYPRETIQGMNILDFDPQITQDAIMHIFEQIRETKTVRLETTHRRKDGQEIPVDVNTVYFAFEDQEIICSFVRDIADRKQQEEALRDSEARQRALLNGMPDMMFVLNSENIYIDFWGAPGKSLTPPEQFLGKCNKDILPADLAQTFQDTITQTLQSKEPQHIEYMVPYQNTHNYYEARLSAIDDDTVLALVRNITERKQAEDDLRIFKTVIENAADGIGMADTEGRITYSNAAYCAMSGYGQDVIGRALDTIYVFEPDQMQTMMQQIMAQGFWRGSLTLRRKDQTTIPVEVSLFPVPAEESGILGTVAIVRDITERKQAEAMQQRLVALVENSPDFIGLANLDGKPIYTNAAARRMVGLDSSDAFEQTNHIEEYFTTEMLDYYRQHIIPAVMEHGQWEGEFAYRHFQTGEAIPVYFNLFTVMDAQSGQQMGFGTVTRDITAHKQQEEALRLRQFALDNATDMVEWQDATGRLVYVNEAVCQNLGYTREDLLEMTLPDIDPNFPPDQWEPMWNHVKQVGTTTLETLHRRKDGSTFPVEVTTTYLQMEGQEFMLGFVRDISERKQEQAQQQMLAALIDNSADFIGAATFEGQAIYLNAAGCRMVGLEPETAISSVTISDFLAPEEQRRMQEEILPVMLEEGLWAGEFRFRHFQTGNVFPVSFTVFTMHDQQTGQPIALGTVTRDLTEQKQQESERAALQQQVIEAQRAAIRELSTPLIPITDTTVVMPLIGAIDSGRAQQIMETLLEGVAQYQAELVILDITGVVVVDTQVAQAFIQAAQAVKLIGAQVMLTGIQPQIAQTLVHLGADLSGILTQGSLQAGVAAALKQ